MKNAITCMSLFLLLGLTGCLKNNVEPITTICPEPAPVKLMGQDTLTTGNYRGIVIGSTIDEAFSVLEELRLQNTVTYLGAVNSYFSEVVDLKTRISHFDELTLDQTSDTPSGVQIQLEKGKVKSITLNDRRSLSQWPEAAALKEAIQVGDSLETLYEKLVWLSKQKAYAAKFEKVVLTTRSSYAILDPVKARLPWSIIYSNESKTFDGVLVHLKDKKVHYITVHRFERQ